MSKPLHCQSCCRDCVQLFSHSARGEGELEMPRAGRRRCSPLLSPLCPQTQQLLKDGGLCPFPYTGYMSFGLPFPVPGKGQLPLAAEQVPASLQPQGGHGASLTTGGGEAPERPLGTVPSPLLLRPTYWDWKDVSSKRKLKSCHPFRAKKPGKRYVRFLPSPISS